LGYTFDMTNLSLIGVPLDLGAQNLGVSSAPKAFRDNGIISKLTSAGFELTDLGDIVPQDRARLDPGDKKLRYLTEIVNVSAALADKAASVIKHSEAPVIIGGDHSVCLGAVTGASVALQGNIGLIYLDAHGDLNTAETSPTGNIHGMHLASLLGFGDQRLVNVYADGAKLAPQNLLLIGGSDYDEPEIELIKREGLETFGMFELLKDGLAPLLTKIDDLASRCDNIWVSLDLDCIDQIYAPGAGMPNAKGLTYREILAIAEYIAHKCHVVGMDLVEYNPLSDQNNKTAELGIELIAAIFGQKYSWYTNYLARNQA
jgi:arginase